MNTRHASRWFWLMLFAIFLAPCLARTAATQSQPGGNANSAVQTANGLTVVTFTVDPGKIIVNLPDDMRAGDTISGTVVAEPKGQTEQERAKNTMVLTGYVIELEPPKKTDGTPNPKVKAQVSAAPSPFTFTLPQVTTPTAPLTNTSESPSTIGTHFQRDYLTVSLRTALGDLVFRSPPVDVITDASLNSVRPISVENRIYEVPTIGQQGRPIEILGPFDGNSTNTRLMYRPAGSSIQDFEKNTENVTGGFGLLQPLAESPRKAVFTAPTNVTGPIELHLKEGKTETKGTFRNVDLKLTAPKTNLRRGEHTELHVEVNGLQGITQPVPLRLESTGVITMEGGNYQPLVIQPSQVGADGRYTTTRGITGVHAGGWGATATVVVQPFDICLQDDNNPQTVILFNSFTGDYKFMAPTVPPPAVQTGGAPGQTGGTAKPNETKQSGGATQVVSGPVVPGVLFPGPIFIGPATGTVTRDGCTISLNDNRPDRVVVATVDMCTHTGSASIQTSPPNKPKIKFTITDRNTADNTCTCGPGCR